MRVKIQRKLHGLLKKAISQGIPASLPVNLKHEQADQNRKSYPHLQDR